MTSKNDIELFFNKADRILFCEKEGNEKGQEPLIQLLFSNEAEFNSHSHNETSDYFNGKRLSLSICNTNGVFSELKLIDHNCNETITLPNLFDIDNIAEFIDKTPDNETIILLAFLYRPDRFEPHQSALPKVPVKIDGYAIRYT